MNKHRLIYKGNHAQQELKRSVERIMKNNKSSAGDNKNQLGNTIRPRAD
jgi:hypothetical protein